MYPRLPSKENPCRANNQANKQQQRLHLIPLLFLRLSLASIYTDWFEQTDDNADIRHVRYWHKADIG